MQTETTINGFRLSPQQRNLWRSTRQSPAFRAQCAVLLEGPLRIEVLQESLSLVVNRHDILRTSFYQAPGLSLPVQVVAEGTQSWPAVRLLGVDQREAEEKVDALMRADAETPFDFAQPTLPRFTLMVLSPDRHVLLADMPALCADARTLANLVREIGACYARCLDNRAEGVKTDEPVPYVQFSEWQNGLLESEESEAGRAFWRRHDPQRLPPLRLPSESEVVAGATFAPECFDEALDDELCEAVRTAASGCGAEAEEFLLACWVCLLQRLTSNTDVAVGVVSDGREYEELHDALGLFARTLPVCIGFEEGLSFGSLLSKTQRLARDAYEFQESYAREASDDDDAADALYSFEHVRWPDSCVVPGPHPLRLRPLRLRAHGEPFRIKLVVASSTNGRLRLQWHYDPRRFDSSSTRRLAAQYLRLLTNAAADPTRAVSRLDVLTDEERHTSLVEWNRTQVDYGGSHCLHQLFEQQAARTPAAIALAYEDERLTYAELDSKASRLARLLSMKGVGPDVVVGLMMERSVEMVVALLAVLKAGGAYLALDPQYPAERLRFMLEDASVSLLLTQQQLFDSLPDGITGRDVEVIRVDAELVNEELSPDESGGDAGDGGVTPEHLAYVIYTSGSTGRPKGVAVEHRQLFNYVSSIVERLDLPAGGSFATVSTLSADLGNTMVFPSLCTGGSLHVISQERLANPDALAEYFNKQQIDCLKIVPSHLEALLSAQRPEQVLPRRRLVLGGEASHWGLVERVRELAPACSIFNHYGPTETTVGVLTHRFDGETDSARAATLPLGRPIANARVYILDAHARPVPVGVAGELYIGGNGLVRGYLGRPALTAERFIPNPFASEPGARLYRTGDLARHLPDGRLEYLGRVDHQVKIRGLRIELGEIEAALRSHASVREAVVTACEEAPGHKRLVAYVVPDRRQTIETEELRAHLAERLPRYMVPSAFITLDSFPLTPNGKIDRKALPAPELAQAISEKSYAAPRTPVEEVLAAIWAEVLGLERVGVHNDFFELGGHSLIAIQVIARIRETLRVDLSVKSIFGARTVAELAGIVVAAEARPGRTEKIAGALLKLGRMSPEEKSALLEEQRERTRGSI
ncbi:MAG TPA: amino acid adenylation domain-containing protein [Pyrinomonadaceae bacterium]